MTGDRTQQRPSSLSHTLVLYDGVCGLCNGLVRFLLRRDRRDQFRFAPLQSDVGQSLLGHHGLNTQDVDTVVVIANFGAPRERAMTRSDAVLWSASRLGGIWKIANIARAVPRAFREALYRLVARHRYRIFGRYDSCPMPGPEVRNKFLGFPS